MILSIFPLLTVLLTPLMGCSPEIGLTAVNNFCTDVDLDNLPDAELMAEVDGEQARVWLSHDLQPAGLTFTPLFESSGNTIEVFALWDGAEGGVDFCYEPTIEIDGIRGKMEIRWFLSPDDGSPYDTIEIKGE
jgi:hypothetical protein